MKGKRWTAALCLALILAFAVLAAGCGAGNTAANDSRPAAPSAEAGLSYEMSADGMYMPAAEPSAAPEGESMTGLETGGGETLPDAAAQKLVYTVDLEIETLDYDASLEAVEQLTAEYGGYVEYAHAENHTINSTRLRSARYVLRVPAEDLDAFLDSCGGIGMVCSSTRQTENRTTEYADLGMRLETLRIEEETLQGLLSEAQDLDAIVTLTNRLSDVRYEIERIESSMRGIDALVSYSTVNLYLDEVLVAKEEIQPDSGFFQQVGARLRETWSGFVSGLERFGIFALGVLPVLLLYLLPAAIVVAVVLLIIRGCRRRRSRRLEARTPEQAQPPEKK